MLVFEHINKKAAFPVPFGEEVGTAYESNEQEKINTFFCRTLLGAEAGMETCQRVFAPSAFYSSIPLTQMAVYCRHKLNCLHML